MKAWWRAVGWGILAAGLGLGLLGLTGDDEWLATPDRAARAILMESGLALRTGASLKWDEYTIGENQWRWQGRAPEARARIPMRWIELNRERETMLANPTMGPLDLAALLQELRGTGAKALVIGCWPTNWEAGSGVTLRAVDEEIFHHPGVVASAELGLAGQVLDEERRGLAMMPTVPPPVEEMDLPLVNSARIGWPVQEPPLLLWAGVPGLGMDRLEIEDELARVPLLVTDGQRVIPTLPLAVALEVLGIGANDLSWEPGRVLVGGQRLRVRLDKQGRLAVPSTATEAGDPGEGWQGMRWHELLGLRERAELSVLGESTEIDVAEVSETEERPEEPGEGSEPKQSSPGDIAEMTRALAGEEAQSQVEIETEPAQSKPSATPSWRDLPLLGEVVWIDSAGYATPSGAASAGRLRARALGALINPQWRVLEIDLIANRPLAAALAFILALVLAAGRVEGRGLEIGIATVSLLFILLVSYLALFLAGWWVSPLPALAVLVTALLAREIARRRIERGRDSVDQSVPTRPTAAEAVNEMEEE